jgi:hypothetical protein
VTPLLTRALFNNFLSLKVLMLDGETEDAVHTRPECTSGIT